jgi:hypothetical protein
LSFAKPFFFFFLLVESCGLACEESEDELVCAVDDVVLDDEEDGSVAASFTRVGAAAGSVVVVASEVAFAAGAAAGAGAADVALFTSVVLDVPPLVEGAVGVGAPVSTGALVSASLAPLSDRGTASLAGAGPLPVVSRAKPDPPLVAPGRPVRDAFAFRTNSTALVCGGSTSVGSPTFAAEDVSG